LHRFPERLELVDFGPVQVLVLELKLARADADVIPLLLLGVEAADFGACENVPSSAW
jgi:hypothetical protein